MTSLAFADNSFDCVTSRFGLMFPEDKVAAAREVLRVLKPGGRVGYIVWGPYDENPPFFVIRRAIAEAMGQEEGAVPHRHSLGQPGQLSEILNAAGFSKATEHEMRYKRPVDDLDDYINRALIRGYSETVDKLETADFDVSGRWQFSVPVPRHFIGSLSIDLDGGINRRHLQHSAREFGQGSLYGRIIGADIACRDNTAFQIICIPCLAEAGGKPIGFCTIHYIGNGFGRFTQRYRQNAGRQRIERARMTCFLCIENSADPADDLG